MGYHYLEERVYGPSARTNGFSEVANETWLTRYGLRGMTYEIRLMANTADETHGCCNHRDLLSSEGVGSVATALSIPISRVMIPGV